MPETRRAGPRKSNEMPVMDISLIRGVIKEELNTFKRELRVEMKEELRGELSAMLSKLLKEEMSVLRQQITEQKKEIEDLKVNITTRTNDLSESVMNEISLRHRKRDFLIVTGLSESTSGSLEERKRHDSNLIDEIVTVLKCDDFKPEDVTRIGKISSTRPRLLRLKCTDSNARKILLVKSKELTRSQKFKQVYINPDLTHSQRERNRELREELKRRREQGENVKIRYNKVVDANVNKQLSHFQ